MNKVIFRQAYASSATQLRALVFGCIYATTACGSVSLDAVGVGPSTPETGLVAHWSFDDATGNRLNDSSGNRRHGVITGGSWVPDGQFGAALHLARGDFVNVDGFPDATAQWTFSGWIRVLESDRLPGDIGEAVSTEAEEGGWAWEVRDDRTRLTANFTYWNGPGDWVSNDYPLESGRWSHLTFVHDASAGTASLYVDAKLLLTRNAPTTFLPGVPTLYMGRWSGQGFPFAGALDDIAIYERALSPREVAELQRRPAPE